MLTIEVTSVSVASFPSPTQKETNISYPLATPSHCVLYVRSSRMSELSRFVYMKSHMTLHVKASAQKVNLEFSFIGHVTMTSYLGSLVQVGN